MTLNGAQHRARVEARLLLSDFIRDHAGLTGTHVACEEGVCGACTVQLDGVPVRSCLMLAVQADGREVATIEGLDSAGSDRFRLLQAAFREAHAVQCGYCTAGVLVALEALARDGAAAGRASLREALSGHACRCTGYQAIVEAGTAALAVLADGSSSRSTTADQLRGGG